MFTTLSIFYVEPLLITHGCNHSKTLNDRAIFITLSLFMSNFVVGCGAKSTYQYGFFYSIVHSTFRVNVNIVLSYLIMVRALYRVDGTKYPILKLL